MGTPKHGVLYTCLEYMYVCIQCPGHLSEKDQGKKTEVNGNQIHW